MKKSDIGNYTSHTLKRKIIKLVIIYEITVLELKKTQKGNDD